MALNEDKYRRIQDYLDKKMGQEELGNFEKKLSADEDLAREVKLHADMETFLADTPENDLRNNLQILSQQVTEDNVQSGNSWRYLLLLIPILVLAGWWMSNRTGEDAGRDTVLPIEDKAVETDKIEKRIDPAAAAGKELPIENNIKEVPPSTPENPPKRNRKKQETPTRPIAANFAPNPSLEFLIENNRRDNEVTLKVEEKQTDIQLLSVDSNFDFQFAAVLQSEADLLQQDFKLHLFSNKKVDFEDFTPLSTNDLSLEKLTDDSYRINFKNNFSLQPGRYYYILEDFTEEEIYFVDKFEVKLN